MQAPKFSLKRSYQVWGVIFLLITLGVNSFIPLCMMCAGMISMHEVTMHNAGQAAEGGRGAGGCGDDCRRRGASRLRRWASLSERYFGRDDAPSHIVEM